MDKNLEWLTQNNEDLKSNKGNLTPTLRDSIFRRSYPPPPFNKGGGGGGGGGQGSNYGGALKQSCMENCSQIP